MLGRYAELKAQLPPGTILFYQVGTFFETFEEDASAKCSVERQARRHYTAGFCISDSTGSMSPLRTPGYEGVSEATWEVREGRSEANTADGRVVGGCQHPQCYSVIGTSGTKL
jgi:hypothetical protein